jgi:addiction module HigA family antidote
MPKTTQTPGTMLKAMLDKQELPLYLVAKEIYISSALLYHIINDKGPISLAVAFRLAKYFNTTVEYWLAAQMKYDIEQAAKDKDLQKVLKGIKKAGKRAAAAAGKTRADKPGSAEPKKQGRKRKESAAAAPKKAASTKQTLSRGRGAKKPAASSSAVSGKTPAPRPARKTAGKPGARRKAAAEQPVEEKRELRHILIKQNGAVIDGRNFADPDNNSGRNEPGLV